jgi:hypothetical protein
MKLMPVRQSLTSKHWVSSYTELSQNKDTEVDETQEVSQADYCQRSTLNPLYNWHTLRQNNTPVGGKTSRIKDNELPETFTVL